MIASVCPVTCKRTTPASRPVLRARAGMRQMMWGDVEADTVHMRPMHAFTAQRVVFSPDRRLLDGMPRPARAGLLSVIAAYLPYYTSEREVQYTL